MLGMWTELRALMFDWGGTIVHVARQEQAQQAGYRAALATLDAAGLAIPPDVGRALRDRFLSELEQADSDPTHREFDAHACLTRWAEAHGVALPADGFLDRLVDACWRPWIGCLDVLGDGVGTLARLQRMGYLQGLVSNVAVPPDICLAELRRQGIADLLAFKVFSSAVGFSKPHDSMYTTALAAARAHLPDLSPDQVLFIGDTPDKDITGPHHLGLRTALVRTGRWRGDRAELSVEPDVVLDSIDDLPALLPGRV